MDWRLGEGSRIVFQARDLEGEPRVCSPVLGHLLKSQRRGMKPRQTDTLEKASESGDCGSWFRVSAALW